MFDWLLSSGREARALERIADVLEQEREARREKEELESLVKSYSKLTPRQRKKEQKRVTEIMKLELDQIRELEKPIYMLDHDFIMFKMKRRLDITRKAILHAKALSIGGGDATH